MSSILGTREDGKATTRTIKFKAVKLSKDLLAELCEVLDEENLKSKKERRDKVSFVSYELACKDENEETEDSKTFLHHKIPNDLTRISMSFRGGWYDEIDVSLWPEFDSAELRIKGSNRQWRNDIIQTIEDIFEKYENKTNEFFHTNNAKLVYVGISSIIAIGVIFLLLPVFSIPTFQNESVLLRSLPILYPVMFGLITCVFGSFKLEDLFHWLYPKIEMENSTPVKVRKVVLYIIGTVVLSLISSGIYSLFHSGVL